MKKFLLSIGISLFGTALALLLVEGVYRGSLVFQKAPSVRSDRPKLYFNSPNSPSLQGNTHPEEKAEGQYRIAVIGDSFTFAPYMQSGDAFPARLEQIFRLSGNSQIEVMNYGVPGYSTSHEVGETRKAIKNGSDLVLLQITLNDPQRKSYQPTGLTGINQFGAYSPPPFLAKITRHWKTLGLFFERIHNTHTHQRYEEYYLDLFNDKRSWKQFVDSLHGIRKTTKKNKVRLVAVVFPLFGVPINDHYPFENLHKKVHQELKALEVPALDLLEAYRDMPLNRLQVIPGGDFHPNEIGHRIAAEEIYLWLETQGIVPEQFFSTDRFTQRTDIRLQEHLRHGH